MAVSCLITCRGGRADEGERRGSRADEGERRAVCVEGRLAVVVIGGGVRVRTEVRTVMVDRVGVRVMAVTMRRSQWSSVWRRERFSWCAGVSAYVHW